MKNETGSIETLLQSTLTGDATLAAQNGGRVYGYLAPENAGFPHTLFAPLSMGGVGSIGGAALARDLYTVKMVGNTDDFSALQAGADQINALLDGVIAASSGLQVRARWQYSLSYLEELDDSRFAHMGAVYRIYAS